MYASSTLKSQLTQPNYYGVETVVDLHLNLMYEYINHYSRTVTGMDGTLIFENLKLVEISKNHSNIIRTYLNVV